MRRFQIRPDDKGWSDPGPDLYRTDENASEAIRERVGSREAWLKPDRGSWLGPFDAVQIARRVTAGVTPQHYALGFKVGSKITLRWEVARRTFEPTPLPSCAVVTQRTAAVITHRFPERRFGGAFVCKRIDGSLTWSQHAYGKAYDHSDPEHYSAGSMTPDEFSWALRMVRNDLLNVWQIIGTLDGRNEVQARAPIWNLLPYASATRSHLFHVHYSCGDEPATGEPDCA